MFNNFFSNLFKSDQPQVKTSQYHANDLRSREPGSAVLEKIHKIQAENAKLGKKNLFSGPEKPPEKTDSWLRGYEGEQQVGEALNTLKSKGYTVLHAVPIGIRGADIDHLVISPTGAAYTVNTKHHPKKPVTITKSGVMKVNGLKTFAVSNSHEEVDKVRKKLRKIGIPAKDVHPVIVLVGVSSILVEKEHKVNIWELKDLINEIQTRETIRRKAGALRKPVNTVIFSSMFWIDRELNNTADKATLDRSLNKAENDILMKELKTAALGAAGSLILSFLDKDTKSKGSAKSSSAKAGKKK